MRKLFAAWLLPALLAAAPASSPPSPEEEVLTLTRTLLENIYLHPSADFYAAHVDADVTAYEGTPTRVDGIDYHLFALQQLAQARNDGAARHLELLNPKVQLYGDVAIVTATSQVTTVTEGQFSTSYLHETRVWARRDAAWKLVHFHKSPVPGESED
jgi:calcium/calmodulin-dependent protein kinase (CaM kinase) II